jgi:hypothetical protein
MTEKPGGSLVFMHFIGNSYVRGWLTNHLKFASEEVIKILELFFKRE